MPSLFPFTLALYALACTLHFVTLARQSAIRLGRLSQLTLACGVVSHGVDLLWTEPRLQSVGGASVPSLAAWLMLAFVLVRTLAQPAPLLGALLLPVAMVLSVWSHALQPPRLLGVGWPMAGLPQMPILTAVHVLSALAGIALFGIAAASSLAYMLRERRLKGPTARAALPPRGGQSLLQLDTWGWQGSVFGLLALTAALVSGTYLLMQSFPALSGGVSAVLGLQARYLFSQPRYLLAVVTWLLFAGLLVGRSTLGLRGRWAAQLTLVGFWTSLGVLVIYASRGTAGGGR